MKHIIQQSVMSVYVKENLLYPISSTCSTHFTTWLVGLVKCHYQNSMTSIWKTSKITVDVIMYQLKKLTDPIPVPIRNYVSILRESLFLRLVLVHGIHLCNRPLWQQVYLPRNWQNFLQEWKRPELIPGSPICYKNSMNLSMAFFSKTEKVGNICVKTMVKLCKYDVFICFKILSYTSNMLLYFYVILIGITVLVYILKLI